MPTTEKQKAANRANATKSTGPRTPEGKARSSQNARKHRFNPDPFAVVRIESPAAIADLRADAIATYQPINSQELFAVERIALAQHSMLRMTALEAGFFSNCLDQAMEGPARPYVLEHPEITDGIDIALGQHRSYWLALGFYRFMSQHKTAATVLRFQAQAERLYRRAIEDFDRLRKLRSELPPELPNEAIPDPQPVESTPSPAPPSEKPDNKEAISVSPCPTPTPTSAARPSTSSRNSPPSDPFSSSRQPVPPPTKSRSRPAPTQ
jgi:hypothetical protein